MALPELNIISGNPNGSREKNVTIPIEHCAVYASNLCKRYSDSAAPVLHNFGMTVRHRTIYGLLGSSGCGKTTVLSCIVGLRKWDAGELLVLGKRPDIKGCGRKLGYMPQDLALYDQLTAREVCQFYGAVYNIPAKEIRERWKFLRTLLELTAEFKQIQHLSGGQKRRASLALALIHSPALLLLDEPTVGLDPVLREKIWAHLHALVETLGTTIIITTHYIEEARLSNKVGVMRDGRLLVEEAPQTLLDMYKCDLLEQVVLQLCRKDTNRATTNMMIDTTPSTDNKVGSWLDGKVVSSSVTVGNEEYGEMAGTFRPTPAFDFSTSHRLEETRRNSLPRGIDSNAGMCSRIQNNWAFQTMRRIHGFNMVLLTILSRHLWFLCAIILMPTLQGALTLIVLGSEPRGMKIGVVNHEASNWTSECHQPRHYGNSCDVSMFSCRFLNIIGKDNLLNLRYAEDQQEALMQVQQGSTWGYLTFPPNYTQNGVDRAAAGNFAENEIVDGSKIFARLDYSQFVGSAYIVTHLIESFRQYLQQIIDLCDLGANIAAVPLFFRPPVYGKEDGGLTAFIMPGVIIASMMGMTMGLSASLLIEDRKQGTLSRAQAAGLRPGDVIVSSMIIQGVVAIAQIAIWQAVLHFGFKFIIVGPIWLWLTFLLLSGFCGAAMGILLGVTCNDEVEAFMIGVFLIPIFLLFGGVVYPTEAMPPFWLNFGRLMPTHLPTVALRSVVVRGMGLSHWLVWPGIVALLVYIGLFLILTIIAFRKLGK